MNVGGSSVEPKDIKAFRPKPLWTIKERRRLASSPVESDTDKIISAVREINQSGRCATNSLIIYSLLQRRKEKPVMMGVWTSRKQYQLYPLLPSHFFVVTRNRGVINSYPEGWYDREEWKYQYVMPVNMKYYEYRLQDLIHFVEMIERWIK
jgi:hypothetical protein